MDEIDVVFKIDESHPAIQGHFPGRPVVPAVVLLNNVQRLVNEHAGSSKRILKLRHAKFMAPIIPGMEVRINATFSEDGLIKFELGANGKTVATGILECEKNIGAHER
ncbi:hypothetical protein MNBD_NITROSPINAE04-278 [hydrothermal vent metagenome]|uniref:ApeI dehydratase-like domain-containing protein n=1 Tax=hydrothermal vent metagenome TaxID=652676 RepID=A0A3B1BA53_9ZZZZ